MNNEPIIEPGVARVAKLFESRGYPVKIGDDGGWPDGEIDHAFSHVVIDCTGRDVMYSARYFKAVLERRGVATEAFSMVGSVSSRGPVMMRATYDPVSDSGELTVYHILDAFVNFLEGDPE